MLVAVIAVLAVIAFGAFLSHMTAGKSQDATPGIVARAARYIPLQSLKIVIVAWQILTQVRATA